MTASTGDDWKSESGRGESIVLRLYIAGRAPNSLQARANLTALCQEFFPDDHQIEIIDVFEDPMRAIDDNVLATPTLVKVFPPPVRRIIGNLNDRQKVMNVLGIGDGPA